MSLPILLPNPVRAYRGDQLAFTLQVKQNSKSPVAVDLTSYGDAWSSQMRTSAGAALAATFEIDDTRANLGILAFSLDGTITQTLAKSLYWFDVQVTGGSLTPLTVFLGRVQVEGEYTHA